MDIAKMHEEFKISRDGVDSSVYAELMDEEIDFFLNEAMDRYIKTHYSKNNVYRKGFEESQKRTDDLRILVKSKFVKVVQDTNYTATDKNVWKAGLEPIVTTVGTTTTITQPFYDDEAYATISTDEYLFFIKCSVKSCKDTTDKCCEWKSVSLQQQDDLYTLPGDPFNKPTVESPVLFFEDGQLHIWTGKGGEIKNVFLTFIKRPIRVSLSGNTDCELSEHTHKEIVQMAVDITLESLQSPRVQTNEENLQKME